MEIQELHYKGKNDHLRAILKRYVAIKRSLHGNKVLSPDIKKRELKKNREELMRETKSLDEKLF